MYITRYKYLARSVVNISPSIIEITKTRLKMSINCPSVGLGTAKSKPGEVSQAVKDAIDIGYRHIDCAPVYMNEKEVGEAIRDKINEGVVKRRDLYITSKLWNTKHRPEDVEPALKKTLADLGLEYIDLYLMHWPMALKEGDEFFPVDSENKFIQSDTDYLPAWHAMEELYRKGLAKNIGVSNFNSQQLNRVLANCTVKPVTNQVECHPYLAQIKLSEFCRSNNITITAYSPLGTPDNPWQAADAPVLLEDPVLKQIAGDHKKSPAQIALRYQFQRGHFVIPKSVRKSRLKENIEIFDFELSPAEMNKLLALDRNMRYCLFDMASHNKNYPFSIEY